MIRFRHQVEAPRMEIMPLIDVIFLLLTFFIYAMVLMVRVDLLPIDLQDFTQGEPATPAPAVTISIPLDGTLHFNREPIALADIVDRIKAAKAEDPETVIYLALEAGNGQIDRAPILTDLWDTLKNTGLQIHFVGRPRDD